MVPPPEIANNCAGEAVTGSTGNGQYPLSGAPVPVVTDPLVPTKIVPPNALTAAWIPGASVTSGTADPATGTWLAVSTTHYPINIVAVVALSYQYG